MTHSQKEKEKESAHVVRAEKAHPAAAAAKAHPPSVQRVLVVEDMEDTRTTYKQVLETCLEVEVDTVNDGNQALEALSERPYSVMLTDLRMPRVSGMQLIEEVNSRRLPVTVIVTTGF